MAKAKKEDKSKDRKILKGFTSATVSAINDALSNVKIDDLLHNIYFHTEDKDITYLLRQYEKQLFLSKINNEKFADGLHIFYMEMEQYIKTNKLYKKFLQLIYNMYVAMCKRNVMEDIMTGYFDILIQQFPYLTGTTKRVVYGVDNKGRLMTTNEVGNYLTEINVDIANFAKSNTNRDADFTGSMIKIFNRYGYKVKTVTNCHEIIGRDQMITNMLQEMSYFITEETKGISCVPLYRNPMDGVVPNRIFYRDDKAQNKEVKERITHRQMLLPPDGVTAKFRNCGEVEEIHFLETTLEETVVLLFKIKFTDGTSSSGYYDTMNLILYDMWKESNRPDVTHVPLENMVLQNYLNLTCSLSKEDKAELVWFKETKNLENEDTDKPLVKYEIIERVLTPKGEVTRLRSFDRAMYIAELMNIQPFVRNLPMNSSASEVAIGLAEKLGIELPAGKTLVRGFIKKVYRNEE